MFFFQAKDGIRDLVRSLGLGDVYKRQVLLSFGLARAWSRPSIICVARSKVASAVAVSPAAGGAFPRTANVCGIAYLSLIHI